MSVEPSELMSEVWTRRQGHVIRGEFPLGRCLGCSDHSGVFLTKSAALGPAEFAIKLVPTDRALAESLLRHWKRAGGIDHPHLLRLLQWGGCQLDGLPYLYVLMEYADQTLAQLLQRRALTDDEAREMLPPILDALAFMHGQNLVQGQLKPANILVVGDQLKLASDTIRRLSEGTMSAQAPTVYDPPEAWHGNSAAAGDIWALGVCLFEALTRRPPSGWGERNEAIALPSDFSPAFREVVARCLKPAPQDRPSATELLAWARGQTAGSAPAASIQPAPSIGQSPNSRAWLTVVLGAVLILALGWTGVRMVRAHRAQVPAPAPESSLSQTAGATAPMATDIREPVATVLPPKTSRSDVATSPSALQEVIPEVPQGVRRTISGHVKVWVQVIVDQDGSVFAATADRIGPSRYFQRLAIDAAKKWTFPSIDTRSRRLMQIRFDFSRDGTTGRAVTLH